MIRFKISAVTETTVTGLQQLFRVRYANFEKKNLRQTYAAPSRLPYNMSLKIIQNLTLLYVVKELSE
jgi:hypothetical protein